jgi:hypothetical protein
MLTNMWNFRLDRHDLQENINAWPDWKSKPAKQDEQGKPDEKDKSYCSERMLGVLFRRMTSKIASLDLDNTILKLLQDMEKEKNIPPVNIEQYISTNVHRSVLVDLQQLAKSTALEYSDLRARKWKELHSDKEDVANMYPVFNKWQEHFCERKKALLVKHAEEKSLVKSNSAKGVTTSCLLAAVVYHQCRLLVKDDHMCKAREFAWAAFWMELKLVFSGEDVTIVSQPVFQWMMAP